MEYKKIFIPRVFSGQLVWLLLLILNLNSGCKKLIEIPPPVKTITTGQVFSDSANALSALGGLYGNMMNIGFGFGSGYISVYCGESADEMLPYQSIQDPVSTNTLNPKNDPFMVNVWAPVYNDIYQANVILENLPGSASIPEATKNELAGETRFFRAFFYFYLVNLYGDVPIATSSDYKTNALIARSPKAAAYALMINDLSQAQQLLPADYSAGGGERIRINQCAATALLARIYLYLNKPDSAEAEATKIINNTGLFSLVSDLNSVFLKNSSEAILQWQPNPLAGYYNVTPEGYNLIQYAGYPPNQYITTQLLNAFEPGDQRKTDWITPLAYNDGNTNDTFYLPFKYKMGSLEAVPNGDIKEYYMVLRLAEQYLIRAEARARQGNLDGAITDINAIRNRAGLSNLASGLSQDQVLAAVAHERQVELFVEWGHRWFDLVRTGQAPTVLRPIPYKRWTDNQVLHPVGYDELATDPNLRQTPGY